MDCEDQRERTALQRNVGAVGADRIERDAYASIARHPGEDVTCTPNDAQGLIAACQTDEGREDPEYEDEPSDQEPPTATPRSLTRV
jgi:hypothetical protein